MAGDMKSLYLNNPEVRVRLDGHAWRVSTPSRADTLIPLRRIARAVIRPNEPDLLNACLALVDRGGVVHIQDGNGNLRAILQSADSDGTFWAEDLASRIAHLSGNATYCNWLEIQQRHAWSLVFHRDTQGGFEHCRARLLRYIRFFRPKLDLGKELDCLEQQLQAWLQSELILSGFTPVVRALRIKGVELDKDLQPCLMIPLLWRYLKWRRQQSTSMVRERVAFFELQAASPLRRQLEVHLNALNYIYDETAYKGNWAIPHRLWRFNDK